ncbi:MAG: gamma carbonic anhydrase family protein [Desulfatibacillaceae bacterium]
MASESRTPRIHESVYIATGARISGDVVIKEGSSVWYNAVVRGDEGPIVIGKNTNIQDNVVLHSDLDIGIEIGDNCTIGHGAVVRGARICDHAMVGMNATVLTGAQIGSYSVVGANALVAHNRKFPERSLIAGVPARLQRKLTEEETGFNQVAVDVYLDLVRRYSAGEFKEHPGSE